jgi:4-hydroxybenzoate polyprenyltransferase
MIAADANEASLVSEREPGWAPWLAFLKISKVTFWFIWITPAVFAYIESASRGETRHLGWFVLSVLGICVIEAANCAHNELVDQEEDRISQPARATLLASLSERHVWRLVLAGYALPVIGLLPLAVFAGPLPALFLLLGTLAAPLYNSGPRLKRRPVLAEVGIAWAVFCVYASAWTFNEPLDEISSTVWVLTYFFGVTSLIKDLPDVAGDEAVGAAGVFSLHSERMRRVSLTFIYFSPYVLVVLLVAASVLPARFLLLLTLAAAGVALMVWGERARTPHMMLAAYELAFFYVHAFFLFLFLLDTPTTAAFVAAIALFTGRLVAVALGLDPRLVEREFSWSTSIKSLAKPA